MPRAVFLLPGRRGPGRRVEELRAAFAPGRAAALVTASRAIVGPALEAGDPRAAQGAAERLASDLGGSARNLPGLAVYHRRGHGRLPANPLRMLAPLALGRSRSICSIVVVSSLGGGSRLRGRDTAESRPEQHTDERATSEAPTASSGTSTGTTRDDGGRAAPPARARGRRFYVVKAGRHARQDRRADGRADRGAAVAQPVGGSAGSRHRAANQAARVTAGRIWRSCGARRGCAAAAMVAAARLTRHGSGRALQPRVSAGSAVLVDARDGHVLYRRAARDAAADRVDDQADDRAARARATAARPPADRGSVQRRRRRSRASTCARASASPSETCCARCCSRARTTPR